jgi:hypothetical protein
MSHCFDQNIQPSQRTKFLTMGSLGDSSRTKVNNTDIAALRDLLSSTSAEIFAPWDGGYDTTIKRWSMAASKPAGLSIKPTNTSQVATIVKYVAEHNLELAVRGGGHSTAGASSTDGGVLIDLSSMTAVSVDKEKMTITAQGGANWGQVDQEGFKHGVATVGGTVADTGVGGLALGGGYGWLSGEHGLVIDNWISAEIVLASGEIKRVSEEQEPDLFWALRGAGQNFGVVTEFVFKAFEVPKKVWGGMLVFPPAPEIVKSLVDAINEIYTVRDGKTRLNRKGSGGLAWAKPPDAGGQTMILCPCFYIGTEEEGREAFKPLLDLNPVASTATMLDYPTINNILAPPYGMRASMKGAAFVLPLRSEFVLRCGDEFEKFHADPTAGADRAITMLLWELYDPSKVVEGDVGCFANRGMHLNGMICPIWSDPANDASSRAWARDMNALFKAELEEVNGLQAGKSDEVTSVVGKKKATQFYGNYDHYDERSRDIFGDNYERLQGLKKQFDPNQVFNKLFNITPA